MKCATTLGLCLVSSSILSGCGAAAGEDDVESLGVAEGALVSQNAIVPNAIVPNAIVPNAIVPNAIVPNALSPNTLDTASLAAILDPGLRGELSRLFLEYTVGCAFDATQSFSFSWTDAGSVVHQETYQGVVGIAPGWATAPLSDVDKQRLVSACLAARTNYLGTNVAISMRSPSNPLASDVTNAELDAYPHVEGAFWGNLFSTSPSLHACYNADNVAISRAASRYCAAGFVDGGQTLPCGPITLVGSCDAACANFTGSGRFYVSCDSSNTAITTALP